MKYLRKINFFQKNQNPVTYIWYKNSKSLENSIDNPSIQPFIFSLRLLFVTKEKKIFPSKISHSPHWGKTVPVVTYEQNFAEHS